MLGAKLGSIRELNAGVLFVISLLLASAAIFIVLAYTVLMVIWFHVPAPQVLVFTVPLAVLLLAVTWALARARAARLT